MQISKQTFVITGAGSGLGLATAKYLSAQGAHLALLDINAEQCRCAVTELQSDSAISYVVDVTNEVQVEDTFAQIKQSFGTVHGLVNCAGVAPAQRVLNKSGQANPLSGFASVVNINLIGSYNCARVAAQHMASNASEENGVIINTASVAGYEGQIGQTAYAASKAGIIGLCIALARDLASSKIRVNTIAPGIMATPMLLGMPQNVQDALSETVVNPKRLGAPEEFAKLVAHIIDNAYLNGETIRLDGALRMGPK